MIAITNKTNCSGCSACAQICPNNSITMQEDVEGFLYPKVNVQKCLSCGLCDKICPIINIAVQNTFETLSYAVINKDENVRKSSSSGGAFTALAEKIINDGGVVFGAMFDDKFNVVHRFTETVEGLEKFRGSKYVQSIIGDSYKKAKEFLDKDRSVLFTGTPCQIEGLYAYLGKEYKKLITQDIICHGVPSSIVWQTYIGSLKEKYSSDVSSVTFRSKETGWKSYSVEIEFDNGKKHSKEYSKDLMMRVFLRDLCLRPSCYNCAFKKIKRVSDITLADFWGVEKVCPEMFDNKGTSLVIVNSQKGKNLFDDIKENFLIQKIALKDAIKYNQSMIVSANEPKKRNKFLKSVLKKNFEKTAEKYLKTPFLSKIRRLLSKIKNKLKKR